MDIIFCREQLRKKPNIRLGRKFGAISSRSLMNPYRIRALTTIRLARSTFGRTQKILKMYKHTYTYTPIYKYIFNQLGVSNRQLIAELLKSHATFTYSYICSFIAKQRKSQMNVCGNQPTVLLASLGLGLKCQHLYQFAMIYKSCRSFHFTSFV